MSIDWRPWIEIVRGHESFVLTTHMRADCDALGSEVALAHALRELGKRVRIVNGDSVPPHIAFMDARREIEVLGRGVTTSEIAGVQVLVILDTSAFAQLGPMADVVRETSARKVLIDHHVSEDDLGADRFKDNAADSTGRLVLEAITAMGAEITPQMAAALFAAIATDTGWFRFASVKEKTYTAAARLVAAGAVPQSIFSQLYEQNTLARLKLHGRVLTVARQDLGGRLMYSTVSQDDFAETGAKPTDTEDIVNRLLTVAGSQVALLFVELGARETKVSFRSRPPFDSRVVAEQFGGGGHTAAAGVRYEGTLEQAQAAVLDAVRKAMR